MRAAFTLGRMLIILGGLFSLSCAQAQSFSFSPTVLNLNTDQTLTTQTTLYNVGSTPARFKVETFGWQMKGSERVLTPTQDIIANPSEFTVQPGGRQVIRVGLRKKPGTQELTYRLIVRQLELPGSMPQETVPVTGGPAGATAQISIGLAFSLPVYAAPGAAQAKVSYALQPGSPAVLTLTNAGTRHETYSDLVITRGDRQQEWPSFALLAGATQQLDLTELTSVSGPLTLTFVNAAGQPIRLVINSSTEAP
ncbi:molecular chaperone [Deinococcus sp. SDU3-2]|uniref:Molecular chaperone n=1 Tax=Deinococcus terrestris TaxID=2651870 RepID=A0A7X1NUR5_9DEIO|nr:fimbria/pilus periplasmic chaperone [Deinococcus terrestris]MPY66167.1 molecular chaperone [Deinococcus terrestris]